MLAFEKELAERTNTLEIYAMLLVISGEQPEARLEWYDQMLVEDTATICDSIYA